MGNVITIDGIEEAVNNLHYNNKGSLKYRLIRTIREYYSDEENANSIMSIDSDELIKKLWDTDENPSVIRNRRKNLSSIKSSINNELKKLYKDGKNSEGLIIGPANVFEMSAEAKDRILESFKEGADGIGSAPLEQIMDVLKIVNEQLASPIAKNDQDGLKRLDQIKGLIKDLSENIGLGDTKSPSSEGETIWKNDNEQENYLDGFNSNGNAGIGQGKGAEESDEYMGSEGGQSGVGSEGSRGSELDSNKGLRNNEESEKIEKTKDATKEQENLDFEKSNNENVLEGTRGIFQDLDGSGASKEKQDDGEKYFRAKDIQEEDESDVDSIQAGVSIDSGSEYDDIKDDENAEVTEVSDDFDEVNVADDLESYDLEEKTVDEEIEELDFVGIEDEEIQEELDEDFEEVNPEEIIDDVPEEVEDLDLGEDSEEIEIAEDADDEVLLEELDEPEGLEASDSETNYDNVDPDADYEEVELEEGAEKKAIIEVPDHTEVLEELEPEDGFEEVVLPDELEEEESLEEASELEDFEEIAAEDDLMEIDSSEELEEFESEEDIESDRSEELEEVNLEEDLEEFDLAEDSEDEEFLEELDESEGIEDSESDVEDEEVIPDDEFEETAPVEEIEGDEVLEENSSYEELEEVVEDDNFEEIDSTEIIDEVENLEDEGIEGYFDEEDVTDDFEEEEAEDVEDKELFGSADGSEELEEIVDNDNLEEVDLNEIDDEIENLEEEGLEEYIDEEDEIEMLEDMDSEENFEEINLAMDIVNEDAIDESDYEDDMGDDIDDEEILEETDVAEELLGTEDLVDEESKEDLEEIDLEEDADDDFEEIDIKDDLEDDELEEIDQEGDFEGYELDGQIDPSIDFSFDELLEEYSDYGYTGEDGIRKAKLLAEGFNSALATMDRYYNQYLQIPKGKYIVGSKNPGNGDRPMEELDINSFYLGKFPVTNALFEVFIEKTGYVTTAERVGYGTVYYGRYKKIIDRETGLETLNWSSSLESRVVEGACWYQPSGPGSTLHNKRGHPVVQVSREDAMAFAAWTGKRLPTEDEWEAASRTKNGYVFPWGNDLKESSCNIEESYMGGTSSVDNYKQHANEFGIVDIIGNVLEWTLDSMASLSTGEKDLMYITKGGSWVSGREVSLTSRFKSSARFTSNILGFRCVAC